MLQKHGQSSIFDILLRMMPGLTDMVSRPGTADTKAANNLFDIWRNENNKMGNNLYHRPKTIAKSDIEDMEKAGFVRQVGSNLEITSKGEETLKIMILGNDKSIFDTTKTASYDEIVKEMNNPVKTAKKLQKAASNNWWKRFE